MTAYALKPEIQEVLGKIDFMERYKALSEKFSSDIDNYFKVGEVKNKDIYIFRFNISLKYGFVELIWEAWHNGEVRAGTPWDLFVKVLSNATEKVPAVCFHSYDELKEIMKIVFEMYEDFKRELITIYCPE